MDDRSQGIDYHNDGKRDSLGITTMIAETLIGILTMIRVMTTGMTEQKFEIDRTLSEKNN